MNRISRVTLALASCVLLAGCAKTISGADAKKIADGWSAEAALKAGYNKCHYAYKNSAGETQESDLGGLELQAGIAAIIQANKIVVYSLAEQQGVTFKADGNALEIEAKVEGKGTAKYNINDVGLTTYEKVTYTDGSWEEGSYSWTK